VKFVALLSNFYVTESRHVEAASHNNIAAGASGVVGTALADVDAGILRNVLTNVSTVFLGMVKALCLLRLKLGARTSPVDGDDTVPAKTCVEVSHIGEMSTLENQSTDASP
jgi:hypothetical protein